MTPADGSPPADPVAELGEQILAELGDPRTNDTLTRWLSHYTARLIREADDARNAGTPEADSLEAKARDAILDLWRARSAWPNGWPPPRAAAITRLLDELPRPDDQVNWYHQTALQKLHAVHYQILAGLVDLATGNDTDIEQGWLEKYGGHLTPEEVAVLQRIIQQPVRAQALQRLPTALEVNEPGDEGGDTSVRSAEQTISQLASTYQATVAELLERVSASKAEGNPSPR